MHGFMYACVCILVFFIHFLIFSVFLNQLNKIEKLLINKKIYGAIKNFLLYSPVFFFKKTVKTYIPMRAIRAAKKRVIGLLLPRALESVTLHRNQNLIRHNKPHNRRVALGTNGWALSLFNPLPPSHRCTLHS